MNKNLDFDSAFIRQYSPRLRRIIISGYASYDFLIRECVLFYFTKQEAGTVCAAKGLQNTLLDNCVFDILMTNDTSFAEQQSIQIGKI